MKPLFKNLIKVIEINTSLYQPCNKICLFPESGNYIETSFPSIYDKNNNRIKSFKIKSCNNIAIINENEFVLNENNTLNFVRIENGNKYRFQKIKTKLKINSIIKGLNENQIISSDNNGNIKFWQRDSKTDLFVFCENKTIKVPHSNIVVQCYILLVNKILVVWRNALYFYNIYNFDDIKNPPFYNAISETYLNSMIVINSDEQIIAIGCKSTTNILKINSSKNVELIKIITYGKSAHIALCIYNNKYLLIGNGEGNIIISDIKNDYQLITLYKNLHNKSLKGITELSDGCIAIYSEDFIKIWK